jgi:hypothetical protein
VSANGERFDEDVLRDLASSARTRAREAAGRAESARKRIQELATGRHSSPDDADVAAQNAIQQSVRARDALRHSAESHERAARVHDEAALVEEARGRPERAAAQRAAAARSREQAQADRDLV